MRALSSRMRRAGPLAAGLFAALLIFGLVPAVGAQTFEVGQPVDLRGFAHAVESNVNGLRSADTTVAHVGAATASAVVDADADGVGAAKISEVNRTLQPAQDNKLTYARGIGLEAGAGVTPDTEDQLQLAGLAEQVAPPDNDSPTIEEIAGELSPLAYASLVRGEALANSQDSGLIPEFCVVGDDLSRGVGFAEDVEAIDANPDDDTEGLDSPLVALDDSNTPKNGVESIARTRLIPTGTPNNFGLMSEVRQTLAPVTLLQEERGLDDAGAPLAPRLLTLQVAGEWWLRAIATGQPGGAQVQYGSTIGDVDENNVTDVISLVDESGTDLLEGLPVDTLEEIFGEGGLQIPGDPLINLSIGEDPRALAAPNEFPDPDSSPELAANGTKAVGARDVVRLRLLGIDGENVVLDLRIGHQEVGAEVPVGGVNCPIPVTKTADPRSINIGTSGNTSKISITVHNVFDCDLEGVVLTDRIRQHEADPDFKLISGEPTPNSPSLPTGNLTTADVVWELGDIPQGEQRTVTLDLQSATKGGIIRDIAEATGTLANCAGQDVAGLAIAGLTLSGLSNPVDIAIPLAVTGVGGLATPASGAALSVAALGVAAFLRRRP